MSSSDNQAWPTELRVSKDRKHLTVVFDNGVSHTLPAEMLRVLSPSAEVQGHGPGQKVTVPGKRDVAIRNVVATATMPCASHSMTGMTAASLPGAISRSWVKRETHCSRLTNRNLRKKA